MTYTEDFFIYGSTLPADAEMVQLVDSYTKENVNYIRTTLGFDGLPANPNNPLGSNLDGIVYRQRGPDVYYKRVFENEINVLWFKAKANGVASDWEAFQTAHFFASKTNHKTILIPETCDLDFGGASQSFGDNIILKFDGGTIKNAILTGGQTMIIAAPYHIFDNVTLDGSWKTPDNFAYPEWFGTIANDSTSVDLKVSLEKLKLFWNIKFGHGEYFSKLGEIPVRHFEGTSRKLSNITILLDSTNQHIKYGLCLGQYEGLVIAPYARAEYDTLKEIIIRTTSSVRKTHYSGVVMGNAHMGRIEDVTVLQNSSEMQLSKSELEHLLEDVENNYKMANIGVEFRGCSELCAINNLETYSDVGIGFNTTMIDASQIQGVDFPSIYNFYSACGCFGLASVFFGAPNVFNLAMNGIQSWAQGMYGLYSCKKNPVSQYISFLHCSINNVRVEQLTDKIKDSNNRIRSTSIYIDEQDNIENFIINNIRFSGHSNGLYLGGAVRGYFEINNVSIGGDNVALQYFIQTNHSEYSSFAVKMRNVTADMNYPILHNNGTVIDNHYYEKSPVAPDKINYHDVTVLRKTNAIFKKEIDGTRKFVQTDVSPSQQWVKLYHGHIKNINPGLNYEIWDADEDFTVFNIEAVAPSFYAKATMTLFKDGFHTNEPYDSNKIHIGETSDIQSEKINIVYETLTGFWFLINTLTNKEVQYNVEGLIN